jgi:hypothetical protein
MTGHSQRGVSEDKLVGYDGQVRLRFDGREIVFDVAGMLKARSQGEAAWMVTEELRQEITRSTRHDATETVPGWPEES